MNMTALHKANVARDKEWNPESTLDLDFWGIELAGEIGEACNVIKKIERERLGLRGSRATLQDLADELADGIICVDLIACHIGTLLNPGSLPFMTVNGNSLTKLGNEMAAVAGMINHIIVNNDGAMISSMLCILVHRIEAIAETQGIDLDAAVRNKFNMTSEKYKLKTRMD